MIVANPISQ